MTKSEMPIPNDGPMRGNQAEVEPALHRSFVGHWVLGIGRFLCALSFVLATLSFSYGCTIGVFGPQATVDGRPILWKNRDVSDERQELKYFQGSKYRYITNVYANDSIDAWAGVNEKGFGIMNSNSYNILYGGDDPDDGTIMNLALATCASVNEFGHLMDSLDAIGRETPANYGVFDSTGTTSMFESSNLFYNRLDCDEDTIGFILRANFSMTGNPNRMTGKERYERAMQLCVPARHESLITPKWIIQNLARDFGRTWFDPYPLPFDSTYASYLFGYLPTESTLSRRTTRSVEVMVGPRPGEPAGRAMMWILLGDPQVSLPIPAWVQTGPMPKPLDGDTASELCSEAIRLRNYVRSDPLHPEAVNTFLLVDLREKLAAAESGLFAMVDSAEAAWPLTGPTPEQANEITSRACLSALAAYAGFWARPERLPCAPVGDPRATITPTHTRGPILIQLGAPVRSGTAGVYRTDGRRAASFPVAGSQVVLRWNAAGLDPGSYFVVLPGNPTGPGRFTLVR